MFVLTTNPKNKTGLFSSKATTPPKYQSASEQQKQSKPDYKNLFSDKEKQRQYEAQKAAWDKLAREDNLYVDGGEKDDEDSFYNMVLRMKAFENEHHRIIVNVDGATRIPHDMLCETAMIAAGANDLELLQWCLEDQDPGEEADISYLNKNEGSILVSACKSDDNMAVIKYLIETQGINPNIRLGNRMALTTAAYHGAGEALRYLVNKGAWLSASDQQGNTVSHSALTGGQPALLSRVLDEYSAETPLNKINKRFDFNRVNYRRAITLTHAISNICFLHQTNWHLVKDGSEAGIKELASILKPVIQLAQRIKALSGKAYSYPGTHKKRNYYAPIERYIKWHNDEMPLLKSLYHIDRYLVDNSQPGEYTSFIDEIRQEFCEHKSSDARTTFLGVIDTAEREALQLKSAKI